MSIRGFVLNVLPALLYVVGIFVGGSLPEGPNTGLEFAHQDKVMHMVAFGGLQFLAWRATRYLQSDWRPTSQLGISCLITCGLGGLLEIWQSALPTRQAEGLDWVADALGAMLVAGITWRLTREQAAATPVA